MATNFLQRMLRLRSKMAPTMRSSVRIATPTHACAPGSVLRPCTFSTESPKALKMLTLFPRDFPQDAQHDQGVSALLAVGFAKPVCAIQVARPTRLATISKVDKRKCR